MLTPPPLMTPAILKAQAQLRDVLARRGLAFVTDALRARDADQRPVDGDARTVSFVAHALGAHDTLRLLVMLVREREGLPTVG